MVKLPDPAPCQPILYVVIISGLWGIVKNLSGDLQYPNLCRSVNFDFKKEAGEFSFFEP